MSLLEFRCRHKYADATVIDIEFESDRLVTSLFGPSGSGKTTVLEMVSGMRRPDDGRIAVGGRTLVDTARSVWTPLERRRVALVFQDLLLFPHLSVERNLSFAVRRRARPQTSDRAAGITFERVVRVLELESLLQRRPRQLSGGEQQRVALGRALLAEPELLLLDEPLASLDEALKLKILAYLERVVDAWRVPIVFVSHAQAEVRRLAHWVVALERGRVIAQGTPDDVLVDRAVLEWKDAAAAMNLLRIEDVQQADGAWTGRIAQQTLRLPALSKAPQGPLYVELAPGAVVVGRQPAGEISARNHIRGVVRRVVDVADGAFVAVDVGQIVWSHITREALSELALVHGVEVVCHIKTHSLMVIE